MMPSSLFPDKGYPYGNLKISPFAPDLVYVVSHPMPQWFIVGGEESSIEMRYEDENIWLTQKMMAILYDVGTNTINYHIKKIFEDSELQEDSVIRKFRITAKDGKGRTNRRCSSRISKLELS